jgi:hypothetical protein
VATVASTEGQTKEGTHGVPIGEVTWSGMVGHGRDTTGRGSGAWGG